MHVWYCIYIIYTYVHCQLLLKTDPISLFLNSINSEDSTVAQIQFKNSYFKKDKDGMWELNFLKSHKFLILSTCTSKGQMFAFLLFFS